MRHAKKRLQLNRFSSWYKATLKSLVKNLLKYQSIKTTKARAHAVRPLAERVITLAKKNTLAAKREAYKILCDHKQVSYLFNEVGPRFGNKTSGFVRIFNLGKRRGDGADLAILELTEIRKKEVKKQPKKEEVRPRTETALKEEKRPEMKKPAKKFLGGIRSIFKKERDSL